MRTRDLPGTVRYLAVLAVALAGLLASPLANALTATASPTSCQNTAATGTQAWSSPGNAASSNDNYATASVNDNQVTNYLECTGYGFAIPATATITGITVNAERNASNTLVRDSAVRLIKGGVRGSTDRSTTTDYTTSDVVEAHGGAADLWGTTWTPADINAANFGVAFAAYKNGTAGNARTVSVDHLQISVSYTVPFVCTQPANTPSGLTLSCVCDTFSRATLNPSTIFGSNWIVSTSDSTGILPNITNSGYLRLTNSTGNNAKAATVPGIFPASGNYISVEFDLFAYNGSGADGVAVTLSDYSVPAVPGAFGGSLGYAQRSGVNGFAGGWLGVAMDEFGNYQNPTEGRLGGPGFRVDSVGARGSGTGANGYRWLGGTATLAPGVDNAGSSSASPGHTYQVIVDARGEPTSTAIAVNRDTGTGYGSLISIPNVYAAATAQGFTQDPVPANWQISFTGSTGGSTNIHEIGSLRICAQTVYPPSGGAASGFNAIDDAYGTPPIAVQNYLTGHIYTKLVGVPFKLNVAALANSQIQTLYVVSGTKNVTVKLVDNSDNACVLDSSQANYCSAACKAKTAVTGGSQVLSFAPANAGQKQSADFTLNSAYSKLAAIITDGTTTACATDAFSVRPTSLTSAVSTNATNATTAGTPIFRAGNDTFNLTATTAGVAGNAGGYTGVLKINNTALQAVAPATVAGVVAPATFPGATSGSGSSTASGSTFTYSEVGAFLLPGYNPATDTVTPRGIYDGVQTATECASMTVAQCDSLKLTSSWTGVDSVSTYGDCVPDSYSNTKNAAGKYGCNFGLSSNTAGVGRFVPNEFRISGASLVNRQALACAPASAFSYLDEAMGASFTLEAWSGSGSITRNYAGALAKLAVTPSATSITSLGFGAAATAPAFTALSTRVSATGFAGTWPAFGAADAGTVALSGTVTVSSLTTPANNRVGPDGPFNTAAIGVAPVDSDGVQILTHDLDTDNSGGVSGPDHKTLGSTTLYFGQMRLLPAHGSELQPLAIGAEILRWNGTAFVPNGSDSCTRLPVANQGLRDYARNLNAGETAVTSGALAIAAGKGRIVLSAPGAANNGSVNVWADLNTAGLTYLYGRWPALPGVADATPTKYDNPPWATATFGVFKGQWIDMRENYFY
ncbi:MAG: biosis protein MshQ [Pseudomonadota bacterium]|nr:biosis protein MshQ [Pseudomonadota bacterium]